MSKELPHNVVNHVFNEAFSKADQQLEALIDHLIDQENVPRETVMKVLFEHFFLVANRYFNYTPSKEHIDDAPRLFDANYDLMTMAQTRINDFLKGYDDFLEDIGHPR